MDNFSPIADQEPITLGQKVRQYSFTETMAGYTMSWNRAFASRQFSVKFIVGVVLLIINLFVFPSFFAFIQQRQGTLIDDVILKNLPRFDMSVAIFTVIYFSIIIAIRRALQYPQLLLCFLFAYLILNLVRMFTIYMVPLEPPIGLVALTDPVLVPFYGKTAITKDLFFSGHTSTVFLCFLVVQKKWEKILMGIAAIIVAFLLLIQHIHYTIDVIAALFIAYIIYLFARRISAVNL